MIRVVVGDLVSRSEEAVMRPIRSDLAPLTPASRDLGARAGPLVERRLADVGHIPVGGAVITAGGDLPATFLIHVVTSAEGEPQTPATVRQAVRNGLRRAADWGIASLALPPLGISVGVMGAEEGAQALTKMLVEHMAEGVPPTELVIVVSSGYEEQVFNRVVGEVASGEGSPRSEEAR